MLDREVHAITRLKVLARQPMNRFFAATLPPALFSIILAGGLQTQLAAAEPDPSSTPAGTWKWGWTTPSGQVVDLTMRVRQDGTNFNGFLLGRNNVQIPIDKFTFHDQVLSFEAPRDVHGQQSMAKFKGELKEHKLSGQMIFERDGETRVRDWNASRNPETMKPRQPGLRGLWRYKVKPADGDAIDLTVRFRFENGKLLGFNKVFDNEVPVTDLESKNGEIKFNVAREWDGKKFTARYQGKATGDVIKGTIESDFTGKMQTYEWVAWRD